MIRPPFVLQLESLDIAIVLLIIVGAIIVGLYLRWIGWAIFKKPLTGAEGLLGKLGIASTDLAPGSDGEVTVDGLIWKARLADVGTGGETLNKNVSKGDPVLVVGVLSNSLIVKPNKNGK